MSTHERYQKNLETFLDFDEKAPKSTKKEKSREKSKDKGKINKKVIFFKDKKSKKSKSKERVVEPTIKEPVSYEVVDEDYLYNGIRYLKKE